MPYERVGELPAAVRKKYTVKQQRAFLRAYNDAAKRNEPEERRFKIAHAAARRADKASLDAARAFGRASNDLQAQMLMEAAMKDKKKKGYDSKKEKGSLLECEHEDCARSFATREAAEDHALAVHSHDEVRMAISKALRVKFAGPPRRWVWVDETADDWFVYSLEEPGMVDDKLYRQSYTFSDGEATLTGEPVEVRRRTVYEPVKRED